MMEVIPCDALFVGNHGLKMGYIEFAVVCIYSAIVLCIHSTILQLLLTRRVSYC